MIKKEAIAYFEDMNECTYGNVEPIQMAIKALEQEPCNDCISRTQAQTELEMNTCRYTLAKERCGTGKVEWDSHLIDIADAVDIIRNLPSVKPQTNTGHWIDVAGGCECSECGCLEAGYSNFCPDCGAKMEVEE